MNLVSLEISTSVLSETFMFTQVEGVLVADIPPAAFYVGEIWWQFTSNETEILVNIGDGGGAGRGGDH